MKQFFPISLDRFRGLLAAQLVLMVVCLGPASTAMADDTSSSGKKSGWMDPPPRPHVTTSSASEERWSVTRIWAHFRTRSGVIQLCMICMAAGLFILMKKFVDGSGPLSPLVPKGRAEQSSFNNASVSQRRSN